MIFFKPDESVDPIYLSAKAEPGVEAYIAASPKRRRKQRSESGSSSPKKDVVMRMLNVHRESFSHMEERLTCQLTRTILSDLLSEDCQWNTLYRTSAIRALKELSRLPGASVTLSEDVHLRGVESLMKQIKVKVHEQVDLPPKPSSKHPSKRSPSPDDTGRERASLLDQLDSIMRVLNNVLYQHPHATDGFASSAENIQTLIDLIEKPGTPTLVFVCARLLFFATVSPRSIIKEAVENMRLVEVFSSRLTALLDLGKSSEIAAAITEMLKTFFNIGLYYPKIVDGSSNDRAVIGEGFHEALLPFLGPTIRVMTGFHRRLDEALASPWSNAIAVLLNYPVESYEQLWTSSNFSRDLARMQQVKQNEKGRPSSAGGSSVGSDKSSSTSAYSRSRKMASAFFRQSFSSHFKQGDSSSSSTTKAEVDAPILTALLDNIETFCTHYLGSKDIDDGRAERVAKREEVGLEASGEPALLLLRKLASESEKFRSQAKERILPATIDRSVGLDKRSDLTGILVRLMSSSNFPRMARASGEALLAICDGQTTQMTSEIGYGPCAGFLVNSGKSHAFPGTSRGDAKADAGGQPVDPITGMALPTEEEMARQDAESGVASMTMEEKEAEAERVLCLFDRLNRTGVISVSKSSHPLHKAVDSGRIQEIEEQQEEERRTEVQREEEEAEKIVEREMQAFREKKQGQSSSDP